MIELSLIEWISLVGIIISSFAIGRQSNKPKSKGEIHYGKQNKT